METTNWSKEAAEAFINAQSLMPFVPEGGNNTFHRYSYARMQDYINAVTPILSKSGFALSFSCVSVDQLEPIATKNGGKELGARVTMEARLMYSDGSTLTARGFGDGYDAADKGVYKAQTGARKYLMAALLNLATGDEPEDDMREPTQQNGNGRQQSQQRSKGGAQQAPPQGSNQIDFPKDALTDEDRATIQEGERILGQIVELMKQQGMDVNDKTAEFIVGTLSELGIQPGNKRREGGGGQEKTGIPRINEFFRFKVADPKEHEVRMKRLEATMERMRDRLTELQQMDDLPY